MQRLRQKRGFKTILSGIPEREVIACGKPERVAAAPERIPYIRPRLLVREGYPVKIGTPLFEDRKNPQVRYLSPGGGTVEKIDYGPRRVIREIVIKLDGNEKEESFDRLTSGELAKTDPGELTERLLNGGMWPFIRQLPFRVTADWTLPPPGIIVALQGGDMFSPRPGVYLENKTALFRFGLSVLKKFSENVIVAAPEGELKHLAELKDEITHVTADFYPSGDPGVILYQIKKDASENGCWYIDGQHLLLLAEFLSAGRYPVKRIVTAAGWGIERPSHVKTRAGAPATALSESRPSSIQRISGGVFTGARIAAGGHLGHFESSLIHVSECSEDEFFGFIRPGTDKITESRTFLSSCVKKPAETDCSLHGEVRPCINCGYCVQICPVDLYPQFIMKAVLADDLEEALSMGLLDCTHCGLCSYVCPSKIELTEILKHAILNTYKDRS